MAVLDHDDHPVASLSETNRCAALFCLTWVGFFVAIGAITWLVEAL